MSSLRLRLCWTDCFVLLNTAQFLNGEDIHSLKLSVTDTNGKSTSLDAKFDRTVKQLVFERLQEFDMKTNNRDLFNLTIYFVKKMNTNKKLDDLYNYYWIYDMVGAEEPSLHMIDPASYMLFGKTDWKRDDHRTFLTTEIFHSGNLFLIINILKTIKINKYSLTSDRNGTVNQLHKILLKLVLKFGKKIQITLTHNSEEEAKFISFTTKFIEFSHDYLSNYIPYIRHKHFLHKLLNRAIHQGNIECVQLFRTKCKAPLSIHTDIDDLLYDNHEQKLFDTFRNAQYCINIWALMLLHQHLHIDLVICLRNCYDVDEIDDHELLDTDKLERIVDYFMKPVQYYKLTQFDKITEIITFWDLIKSRPYLLQNKDQITFVNKQIEIYTKM